jgi:hypothetical protein
MAIKTITLDDGSVVAFDEWLQKPRFSVVEHAAGQAMDLRAFSYVQGQRIPQTNGLVARNATRSDTNQLQRNRMGHDHAFVVYSMTYMVWALDNPPVYANDPPNLEAIAPMYTGTNLRKLQRFVMVELLVGAGIRKPQAAAHWGYFGQAIGSPAFGSGDALTIGIGPSTLLNSNYGTGGWPTLQNQRQWQLPVVISPSRVMSLRLHTPDGPLNTNQDGRFLWVLDGLERRPIA